MAAAPDVLMHGGALLKELKQGCKMPSLDTLKMKLDEDQERHLEHAASVEAGLTKVRSARQSEGNGPGMTVDDGESMAGKRASYPQVVRAQVEAARAGAYPTTWAEVDAAGQKLSTTNGNGTANDEHFAPPDQDEPAAPTAPGFDLKVRKALDGQKQVPTDARFRVSRVSRLEERNITSALILGMKYKKVHVRSDPDREPSALKHEDEVMDLAFSPDGSKLVAGGEDAKVVLWDIASNAKLWEAQIANSVKAVAYSPSGEYVVAADTGGNVTVWRSSDGEQVGSKVLEGDVFSVAMTSSGSQELLAVGSTEKNVMLFSAPSMEEVTTLVHDGYVYSLAFSPDGTMLAGGGGIDDMHGLMTVKGEDHEMKTVVWQFAEDGSASELGSFVFDDIVHATVFSPNGKLLAVGGENRKVAVLLCDRGLERASELLCAAGVRCLGWSPDSRFLATGGEDMRISLWDVIDQVVVMQLPKATDWYCGVAFSSDGSWLATCRFGNSEVSLYPVLISEEEEEAGDTVGAINGVDANKVNIADFDRQASTENIDTRASTEVRQAAVVEMGEGEGFFLKVEQIGTHDTSSDLQAAADTKIADRMAVKSLMLGVRMEAVRLNSVSSRQAVELQHTDEVMGLAFSPDGKFAATGGEDQNLVIWDVAGGSKSHETRITDPIVALAYAPSGQYVAVVTSESKLVLWDMAQNSEANSIELEGTLLSVAIGKNDILAVGTTEKTVMLYSLPDLQEIAVLQHDGHVRCVSFSPCGGMLAGGGGTDDMHGLMTNKSKEAAREMKTVVWKTDPNGDACKYLGQILYGDIVHAVAFSPSGKVLAVGGENRTISMLLVDREFDKASDLPCAAGVRCLAWSPDSRFLASGGEDMQVTVWDVILENVVYQTPKVKDWLCSVSFSPCGQWLGCCGFGHNEAKLHPIELEVLDEEQLVSQPRASMMPVRLA